MERFTGTAGREEERVEKRERNWSEIMKRCDDGGAVWSSE